MLSAGASYDAMSWDIGMQTMDLGVQILVVLD